MDKKRYLMENEYYVEAYSERTTRFLRKHMTEEREDIYVFKGSKQECDWMQRRLAIRGIKSNVYSSRFHRSSNYRKLFFDSRADQQVFRCAYCGRICKKEYITVDHVIPVHDAKRYVSARLALRLLGCSNVNDLGNLAPSCFNCNKLKGANWNLIYLIRAKYGESEKYWKFVWVLRIALLVIGAVAITVYGIKTGLFSGLLQGK